MKSVRMTVAMIVAALAIMAAGAQATTYNIGPGQTYTSINACPWESIAPGDTVNIYYRDTPYNEKIVISVAGTSGSPVLIHGVPGPNGELPVIDGNGATTRTQLSLTSQNRQVVRVGATSTPNCALASYITIENLDIKSGRAPYTYTNTSGVSEAYVAYSSGVRIQAGDHITLRNCIIRDSGNGFLTSPQADATTGARNVLMEKCWLVDNGYENDVSVHSAYTESVGITYQYNYFDRLRAGCTGTNLKERSSSQLIRYNWFESAPNRELDIPDSYDSSYIRSDPGYLTTRVYGNVFIEESTDAVDEIISYGGDMGDTTRYRENGWLYFYNNTVISKRTSTTTLFKLKDATMNADCRNNILYTTAAGSTFALMGWYGRLDITHNWIKTGYVLSHHGWTTPFNDDLTTVTGASPTFVDEANKDFRIQGGSACVNAGTSMHANCSAYPPDYSYAKHQRSVARGTSGTIDIGAYESGVVVPVNIETLTLPNGVSGAAYSQTLVKTGGTASFTWAVVAGTLPTGLSLGSGTGTISGTPTVDGQDMTFTVRVTDSAGTPTTDTQVYRIAIGGDPNYQFAASDTAVTTTATAWVTKTTLSFTPGSSDDWIIMAFADITQTNSAGSAKAQMTVDGVTEGDVMWRPTTSNDYGPFFAVKKATLSTAAHTVNLQYCTGNASYAAGIRNARVVAIRKSALLISSAASDAQVATTTSEATYATLNFTPATAGKYLIIYSFEYKGDAAAVATYRAKLDGTIKDEMVTTTRRPYDDYLPFCSFVVADCTASAHTAILTALKTSANAEYVRRCRIQAIRLADGRFADAVDLASDGESTTTSTAFQQKLSNSWSAGSDNNWLLLESARINMSNATYQVSAQTQLNNTTTMSANLRKPNNVADYMQFGGIDVRNVDDATRYVDVDYMTSNAAGTAKIKYAHSVALPLS